MDRLTKLEVFSKIAETGSFFETARSLNLSRPTVTRLMAELEKDLNQKLLFRNTRRVSLTSAGESFSRFQYQNDKAEALSPRQI